ncbi:hypothetical protein CDD80_4838 [Ophiocordyceps camponoti-rufipedis]|uniref:Magnesium-transporting ATPase, P-type 1 n=1 Tax=Ophiocordyceps camponoti-rufipedis TaxID=2004952 RepID=A0A2C5YWT9_9HYPO|nr:hypothetical protein CDD80_4838 [Ophiocordyceps camponoti-rufipedis]
MSVMSVMSSFLARILPGHTKMRSNWPDTASWARPPSARDESPEAILYAFASAPMDHALAHLMTDVDGLTEAEAAMRRGIKGLNVLPTQKPPSWFRTLIGAIPNPFNILLIFLAIINAVVPDRNWASVIVLLVMVFISIVVRFWQEYRSSLAVFRLQSSITNLLKVRRPLYSGGSEKTSRERDEVTVTEKNLVPGDVVWLTPGCVVPADCLILEASFLRISQSSWTGENEPVAKIANPSVDKEASLFDLPNIVFMGTSVVSGNGVALVLRTGGDVLVANMANELTKKRVPNAFQIGIRHVSYMLIGFMCVMVPIVLCISGKTTGDWNAAALFSVSVAVGLVPEMLPAIVNANLARGAFLLSGLKAIVKRLDSIQNLGAMTVLCSDKVDGLFLLRVHIEADSWSVQTGTLTKDEITLCRYIDLSGNDNEAVLKLASVDAKVQGSNGNNIDQAILQHRLADGTTISIAQYEKLAAIPFTFERRRSSCIVRGATGEKLLISKGAFDEVLSLCSTVRQGGVTVTLDADRKRQLAERAEALNRQGYRVLLVAEKQLSAVDVEDEEGLNGLESRMTLEGILTFIDPPKDDAAMSIASLKMLGVEVKVLTGDSLPVALNVCQGLGLLGPDDETVDDVQATTGPQLAALEGTDEFDDRVRCCSVFAKLTPQQKALVVGSLRKAGHCVGMLGDGINDCMALRRADVGISVDSGASVAKECADLILTEKGLGIMVASVKTGRITHGNTIKYIKMVASSNFGNVFSVLAASAWLPFQPMLGLQLLAQNLLYDISQIAIPWDRVDDDYVLTPKQWNTWDLLRFVVVLGPTSSVIDILTYLIGYFYYGVRTADSPDVGMFQAHWFLQGLLTQTLIVHLLRTAKIPFVQSRSTKPLAFSTAGIMAIGFAIPWIPPFRRALGMGMPAPSLAITIPTLSLVRFITSFSLGLVSKDDALAFPCLDALDSRSARLRESVSWTRSAAAIPSPSPSSSSPQIGSEPSYTSGATQMFHSETPLRLDWGGLLPEFDIAYETWGRLNPDRSNAILLHTGLSASSHAASTPENGQAGWWERFIGPGAPLDTDRFFVICTNVLGGCYGSTGPSSLDPANGERYATRFPILTIEDMVRAQFRLLDHLDIPVLYASVGASMGGMQALSAGLVNPHRVSRIATISGCARSHPYSIALRHAQRQVLMMDPNWNRGFYYGRVPPHAGMKLAREIATVTYRSGPEWEMRFGRRRAEPGRVPALCPDFLVETYLDHAGEKWCLEYDANSLLYVSKAMDLFDLSLENQTLASTRRNLTQPPQPSPCGLTLPETPYKEQQQHQQQHQQQQHQQQHNPQSQPQPQPQPTLGLPPQDLISGLRPLSSTPTLVMGVATDILFPAWQQREIADALRLAGNRTVEYVELDEGKSLFGHDTFLLDIENVGGALGRFLRG